MGNLKVLEWEELYWDVYELAKKIKKSDFKADMLVAVARGGWVIGRILSDILGLDNVAGLTIKFYKDIGETDNQPRLIQPLPKELLGKRILLVDDIVDTGETLRVAIDHVKARRALEVRSAVPYIKPWAKVKPDYYIKVFDSWVVFPYEYMETIKSLSNKGLEKLSSAGLNIEKIRRLLELK